jgi:hypothetical protein
LPLWRRERIVRYRSVRGILALQSCMKNRQTRGAISMRAFGVQRLATTVTTSILAACAALISSAAWPADSVSGTVTYQSKSGSIVVSVKNVYLVKGLDAVDKKVFRRLIFTSADLGAKINACADMSCADSGLREGLEVDLVSGPRMNYWFVGNDQRVQYSGSARPEALKLTTDTPQRLAGKLTIDDSAAGGAKISIDFDATMLKEFSK